MERSEHAKDATASSPMSFTGGRSGGAAAWVACARSLVVWADISNWGYCWVRARHSGSQARDHMG